MRFCRLHPDDVSAQIPGADALRPRSLGYSIIYGAISFSLVSLLAYSPWAFRLVRGSEGLLYTVIALIYLAVGGFALSHLVVAPRTAARFAGLFAVAFIAYALIWSAFWFGLRGKYYADLWGAALGLFALTALMATAFGAPRRIALLLVIVFVFHSAGYYLGGWLYSTIGGRMGRLAWGAAHGLGFGAGLGYLLHSLQAPRRARIE